MHGKLLHYGEDRHESFVLDQVDAKECMVLYFVTMCVGPWELCLHHLTCVNVIASICLR